MMFSCVKSRKKFKILDTLYELLCYCGFALRLSIVYCKQSTKNRHISSIDCADKWLKSQHVFMFLRYWTFPLLVWKDILFRRCGNFAQCWDENMHFEHLSRLRQSRCKSKNFWLACVAWENLRNRMFAPRLPQKFVKVGRKPNVNVKKIAVVDFVDLTFLLGENQPHVKINFRRREKLNVRGWF